VNLTHRNWTAIGLPELSIYPLVDPRGLVTPLQDGWSIDCWLLDSSGRVLVPSRLHDDDVRQELVMDRRLAVATSSRQGELSLRHSATVIVDHGDPTVEIDVHAISSRGGLLVVSVRPYNPEGVQFIDRIKTWDSRDGWTINGDVDIALSRPADKLLTSTYSNGDVFGLLTDVNGREAEHEAHEETHCKVGMATAAAVYRFEGPSAAVQIRIPLMDELAKLGNIKTFNAGVTWPSVRLHISQLRIPDARLQFLYDAAVQTLVLLSADEIVPGPYTYRRFWFRDACLMMNALLCLGLVDRCRRAIERFPSRQLRNGYFRSQEGEWDSNGQVLWVLNRYQEFTGDPLGQDVLDSLPNAVAWINRKRVRHESDPLHNGLLPAGFSAEHLGPNDYYYWDDFWAEAGLRSAARIFARLGRTGEAADVRADADHLRAAIDRSVNRIPAWRSLGGIPASPYRRIDSGAIGSLVADYPLQLYPPNAPAIMATVDHLLRRSFLHGGFFQDMIHSGVNAYLTLDIAQTLLRAGDPRYRDLVEAVARMASPTGQWPEAIHPQTGGGCMGDGQHGWAAAEWVMMIRSCFIREEGEQLIIGSGIFAEWLETKEPILFGPTLTSWGEVTITIQPRDLRPTLTIDANWRGAAPSIDVLVPGCLPMAGVEAGTTIELEVVDRTEESGQSQAAFAQGVLP
jgi:hypothetical protein